MPGIFYHNEMDVLSLSALFSWLAAILEDPSDERFTDPGDLLSVGRVLEVLQREHLAEQVYSSDRLQQFSEKDRLKSLLLRARLQKRKGNLEEASALWQVAATAGSIEALVELAKYFEHQVCDFQSALRCTEQALSLCSDPSLASALLHRKSRLNAKLLKDNSKTR